MPPTTERRVLLVVEVLGLGLAGELEPLFACFTFSFMAVSILPPRWQQQKAW